MSITRQELAEWIDQEGGIDYFVTGHGFDHETELADDPELLVLWRELDKRLWAADETWRKVSEMIGY